MTKEKSVIGKWRVSKTPYDVQTRVARIFKHTRAKRWVYAYNVHLAGAQPKVLACGADRPLMLKYR